MSIVEKQFSRVDPNAPNAPEEKAESASIMSTAIELREITLDVVFPRDAVPIVLMQPLVEMALDRQPYRWLADKVDIQCDAVQRTLAVASLQRAYFTVFPEYSLPGLDGVKVVHQAVCSDSWHANSVVIAGVDGLDRDAYQTVWDLLRPSDPISGNEPQHLDAYEWVNCCVVWVKEASGAVRAFVQPKLTRAWLEQQVRCEAMRTGQGVYVFRGGYEPDGYPCRFLCLICFDWIGVDGGRSALDRVLAELNERWQQAGTPNPLHWLFVPQCNDKPCHSLFLTATNEFFLSGNHPFVERRDGVVVHANCASRSHRARPDNFGFSSVVFHPDTFDCTGDRPATVCCRPSRLRGSDILARCQDVLFREMGPCAHSLRVRVPKSVRHDAAGRVPPVDRPCVHSLGIDGEARTPAAPVPASAKWLHDCLDEIPSVVANGMDLPLAPAAEARQQQVVNAWRSIRNPNSIESRTLLAACVNDKEKEHRRRPDPDDWETVEEAAVTTAIHASVIASVASTFSAGEGEGEMHGRGNVRDCLFDLAGPTVSVLQQRLRPVFGFGELHIQSFEGNLRAVVDRDGRELIPTDFFSESQKQVLMLSLFLSIASTQTWSSFAPVLMDDPVTHFDDLNAYAFVELIRGLLTGQSGVPRQFVISTCDERLYQMFRQQFAPLKSRVNYYEFRSIGSKGPVYECLAGK